MAFIDVAKKNPIEYFTPDKYRDEVPFLYNIQSSGALATAGLLAVVVHSKYAKVPLTSGIQRYLCIPVLAYVGYTFDNFGRRRQQEKLATIKHYIELHPEDFPDYPARVKVGATLKPWLPVRPGS